MSRNFIKVLGTVATFQIYSVLQLRFTSVYNYNLYEQVTIPQYLNYTGARIIVNGSGGEGRGRKFIYKCDSDSQN